MAFSVACAQFSPKKADLGANLRKIAEIAAQAALEGADLVAFAETSTTGYFLEGGVLEGALEASELCSRLGELLSGRLRAPLDVVAGFYEKSDGNLHNSAAYLQFEPGGGSSVVHVYRKFFLPTYGVFDEERFVSRGGELGVFDSRLGRIGILICEDVWHSLWSTLASLAGAQLLIVPSASPARGFAGTSIENHDRYRRMLRAICEEHGVFAMNVQLTGFEGGKGFVGGSMVVDPHGRTLAESPIQEDHLLLAEVDFDEIGIARAQTPLISDLRGAWDSIRELAAGIDAQ